MAERQPMQPGNPEEPMPMRGQELATTTPDSATKQIVDMLPDLELVPKSDDDILENGVRIRVIATNRGAMANNMGVQKAYAHRGEYGIAGNGVIVDAGFPYPAHPQTFERLQFAGKIKVKEEATGEEKEVDCVWRQDIVVAAASS